MNLEILHTKFTSIGLDDTAKVKLMNRTDRKYWFHIDLLSEVLESIAPYYYTVQIGGEVLLPYQTTYFDTEEDKFYIAHHNGKKNRFKVRRRCYVSSGIKFLEVKFKTNKGRTIKNRIETDNNTTSELDQKEIEFLNANKDLYANQLVPSLQNKFNRITLVNKDYSERCTIDLNISFTKIENKRIDELVIVEIKSEKGTANSPLQKVLQRNRINCSSFSKYCIGRSIVEGDLKQNRFKQVLRKLSKTLQIDIQPEIKYTNELEPA